MRALSPDSESEEGNYGGARAQTLTNKHRRRLQAAASGHGTPQMAEVRFSTRRAAKVSNYNEEEDLGLSEEDTEAATPAYYAYEDNTPAIDAILNHRLKDGVGKCCTAGCLHVADADCQTTDANSSDKHDFEFYVSEETFTLRSITC